MRRSRVWGIGLLVSWSVAVSGCGPQEAVVAGGDEELGAAAGKMAVAGQATP